MKLWICVGALSLCLAGCERKPQPAAPESSAPPVAVPAARAPVTEATAERAPTTSEPLEQARNLKATGKLAEARDLLLPLADNGSEALVNLLNEIDTQIMFTPAPAPEKVDYTIVAGDSLGKIAKQHRVNIDLIKKANGLTADLIRVGNRLRIYQAEFAVVVSKTGNTLTVTDRGKFFKRYRVGTGEYSKTPVGDFKITVRQEKPVWHRGDKIIPFGDPANILGTHWLGLDMAGYGIHGTWDTNSIGHQASAGCIRLLNDDVAELYVLLPVGTPVTIRD